MEDEPLACFCLLLDVLLFFLVKSLAEAVGLSNKLRNVPLVRQAVEESCRHFFVPKNRRPVGKPQIGRNNDRNSLIQVRAKLEQALRPFGAKGDEADFIQNNQIMFEVWGHELGEAQ